MDLKFGAIEIKTPKSFTTLALKHFSSWKKGFTFAALFLIQSSIDYQSNNFPALLQMFLLARLKHKNNLEVLKVNDSKVINFSSSILRAENHWDIFFKISMHK